MSLPRRLAHLACLATLLALPAAAMAQVVGGLDLAAERARLSAERERITRTRTQQEAECQSRFAVTGCVEDVRKRWQAPLAEIDRQERVLSDAERRQRSADQVLRLERREAQAQEDAAERRARAASDQQAREARAASKASGPQPTGTPRDPQASKDPGAGAKPAPGKARGASEAAPAASSGPSPAQARANADAHAERVRQAEAHKASVRQRQAERKAPPASDLPPLR